MVIPEAVFLLTVQIIRRARQSLLKAIPVISQKPGTPSLGGIDFQMPVEQIIQNACFIIRESVDQEIDFKCFAEKNNIGYSYFRKMFKKYTGVPPVQYHLDLKILRAKEMLLSTDKIIKEISYELGFQSIYYFSRVFKKKLGVSPSEIRKTVSESPNN